MPREHLLGEFGNKKTMCFMCSKVAERQSPDLIVLNLPRPLRIQPEFCASGLQGKAFVHSDYKLRGWL